MTAHRKIDYRNFKDHAIYKRERSRPDQEMTSDFTDQAIAETREGRGREHESFIAESFQNRLGDSSEFDPLEYDPALALNKWMKADRGLRDAVNYYRGDNKAGISESQAFSGYTESPFAEEYQRNIELGAARQCELAAFGLVDCVDTINVGCGNRLLTTSPNYGDWLRTAKKLESTKFIELGQGNSVQFLKGQKYKIAIAICREDICNPMHSTYLNIINNMAVMDDIRKERSLADLFFNMGPIDSDGNIQHRYPFIYNQNLTNTYIPIGANGQPWNNLIQGDPFDTEATVDFPSPTRCNIDLMSILDKLDEDRTDLSGSCLPLDCEMGDMQLISASRMQGRRLEAVFGPKFVEYCMQREDGCKGTFGQQEGGRDDISVKYSKWLRQRGISFLMANCGLTATHAKQYLEHTWWVGRPRTFAAWAQEWTFQTYDRGSTSDADTVNVTSESFDKEIMFMRKWMGKGGAIVTDPTQGTLFQALPSKPAA